MSNVANHHRLFNLSLNNSYVCMYVAELCFHLCYQLLNGSSTHLRIRVMISSTERNTEKWMYVSARFPFHWNLLVCTE